MPALRLSKELAPLTESGLDRDTAQQTWQALQLKPEEVIAQRLELVQANAKAQAATKLADAARAEVVQLQAKLRMQEETRWQHPAVYGAGAALVGLGWLWLSERKKRVAAQEQTALLLDEHNSVLAMPEGPTSSGQPVAESEPVFKPHERSVEALIYKDPIAQSISQEDLLPYQPEETAPQLPERPAAAVPWWKRLGRKKAARGLLTDDSQPSLPEVSYLSASSFSSQQTLHDGDDALAELEHIELHEEQNYDPTVANLELLTQTRIRPASSEDAMGHLLEVRMAVQALGVLEQPHAAQKLLLEHIDAVPNTCAWAYMQYLDLASQQGHRDAFESMRKRYRLQFNRLAPYWGEPNTTVQGIENYDRPMAELCAAWSSHERARTLIATWLLGTLHSRRLFQLPAYHDLLDLYEMLEFYDDEGYNAQDFVPTVSLLDLDYEFAVEVELDVQPEQEAIRAIPAIKTGDFAVDFNIAQNLTQPGTLTATPAPPPQR